MWHKLLTLIIGAAIGGVLVAPTSAYAAGCADTTLFGIPAWHNGLPKTGGGTAGCQVNAPGRGPNDLTVFVWTIALNIVQAFFVIAGYAAMLFVVLGGFRYITSTGQSDKMASAKKSITNAVIGLIIALLAAAAVGAIQAAIRS